MVVVVDTNVFVSALMSPDGASREIIRRCLLGRLKPLMGKALFTELEDVCSRENLFEERLSSKAERSDLLDAFAASCRWVHIYYLWRPNLRDEADNHIMELAVAGGAMAIITMNSRDFMSSELRFPNIEIVSPKTALSFGV